MRAPVFLCFLGVACSGGGPATPAVLPDPRDPAVPPPGVGQRAIEMRGSWVIRSTTIELWDPLVPPADPVGQEFEIVDDGNGRPELRSFGWHADVRSSVLAQGMNVRWTRNDGDGRLLIYGLSAVGGPIGPAVVGWTPQYLLGIAIGSSGTDTLVGRYSESGGSTGNGVRYTFIATRSP